MRDFEGTPLQVGDKVAFVEPYKHFLKLGTVYRLTPKGVTVEWGRGYDQGQWTSRKTDQVMLMNK